MLYGTIKGYDDYLADNSRYLDSQLEAYGDYIMYDLPTYDKVDESESDKYIETKVGNSFRLDNLSMNHYGDPKLFWVLALSNDIRNPLAIEPGDLVRLPSLNASIMSGVVK